MAPTVQPVIYCLVGLQEPTTHLWEAVGPGISLSLQTESYCHCEPHCKDAARRQCLLSCVHSRGPGMAPYPQDLLGDEEMKLHWLREGKTLAQGHLPVGRGGRVNFLTPSQQSSLTGRQPENTDRANSTSSLSQPTAIPCSCGQRPTLLQPVLSSAPQRALQWKQACSGC